MVNTIRLNRGNYLFFLSLAIIIWLCSIENGRAQSMEEIESQIKKFRARLADNQATVSIDSLILIAQKSESIGYDHGVSRVHSSLAWLYAKKGDLELALASAQKSLDFAKKVNDDELIVESNYVLSGIYSFQHKQIESYRCMMEALEHARALKDYRNFHYVYLVLANLMYEIENYEQANDYMKAAMEQSPFNLNLSLSYTKSLLAAGQKKEAKKYVDEVNLFERDHSSASMYDLLQLARIARDLGEDSFVFLYRAKQKLGNTNFFPSDVAAVYIELAESHQPIHKDSFNYYLDRIQVANGMNPLVQRKFHLLQLSREEKNGNWPKAYQHLKSLYSQDTSRISLRLSNKIYRESIQRIEELNNSEKELYEAQLQNSKANLRNTLIMGLVIGLMAIVLLVLFLRLRKLHRRLTKRAWYMEHLNQTLEEKVKERTHQLALTLEEVQKRNKNLEEIAWTYSHDFRAPFARLMGLIQLLQYDHSDPNWEVLYPHFQHVVNEIDSIIKEIINRTDIHSESTNHTLEVTKSV